MRKNPILSLCLTRNSELRTRNPELKTQNSKLGTRNSDPRTTGQPPSRRHFHIVFLFLMAKNLFECIGNNVTANDDERSGLYQETGGRERFPSRECRARTGRPRAQGTAARYPRHRANHGRPIRARAWRKRRRAKPRCDVATNATKAKNIRRQRRQDTIKKPPKGRFLEATKQRGIQSDPVQLGG